MGSEVIHHGQQVIPFVAAWVFSLRLMVGKLPNNSSQFSCSLFILHCLNIYHSKHRLLSSTWSSPVSQAKGNTWEFMMIEMQLISKVKKKTHASSSSWSVVNRLIWKPPSPLDMFSAFMLPIRRASRFNSSLANKLGVSSICSRVEDKWEARNWALSLYKHSCNLSF